MKNFATYIEYILMTRHYVFVPGIGGFMLQRIPAKFIPATRTDGESGKTRIVPPSYAITFNRLMSADDGLLANAYMETDGVDYATAEAYVRREADAIRTTIETTGRYVLGALGTLVRDADYHIAFVPAETTAMPCAFGMETVEMMPLNSHTDGAQKSVEPTEPVITITIRRRWLRWVAVAAAVIICFFANVATVHTDQNADRHLAAIIDGGIINDVYTPHDIIRHTWEDIIDSASTVTDGDDAVILPPLSDDTKAPASIVSSPTGDTTTVATVNPAQATVATPANGKSYYIIVASCTSRREADRVLARFATLGYDDLNILERDGRFRLYIKTFQQKSSAEDYLTDLRKVATFHDAWLLPVRSTQISKNNDNEQSFSMELSLTNIGTDRDEG